MTAAVPVLPVLAAEENCVEAMQEDSAEEEPSDDDVMEYLRSPGAAAQQLPVLSLPPHLNSQLTLQIVSACRRRLVHLGRPL